MDGTYRPDDIRVFIKDEPHKVSKMRAGRYRLIMVMSLEDQVLDRVLMSNWSEEEKFWRIPGKSGWSPVPAGYRYLNSAFPGDVLATDCTAFDWTFPEWVAKALLQLRLDMMVNPSEAYIQVLSARWRAVLRDAIVRLPDGRRFQQNRWGLMKSGWFRTIAENSSAQVLINALAWYRSHPTLPFPTIWTMGDDVLMSRPPQLDVVAFEKALATTGILVKASSNLREFAGFEFGAGTVRPLYAAKHKFALHFVLPTQAEEIATAYSCLYALVTTSDLPPFMHKVLARSAWTRRLAWLWAVGKLANNMQ